MWALSGRLIFLLSVTQPKMHITLFVILIQTTVLCRNVLHSPNLCYCRGSLVMTIICLYPS